mmetsp:Transcript_14073/g.38492  ORF Transcript_14073/g.38492 Transcript_14073/m.38492 type:complete len:364 (+) Transcript_14073:30-1121(+)
MLLVGSRVSALGRGLGVLAVDNEDGTWNVDFDDGTEENVPVGELEFQNEQFDWSGEHAGCADAQAPPIDFGDRRAHVLPGSSAFSGLRGCAEFPAEAEARWRTAQQAGERDAEEAEWRKVDAELARDAPTAELRRSRLSAFFLFLFVAPTAIGTCILLKEWLEGPLITLVPLGEAAQTENIFSGGKPWLVACVTSKSAKAKPPKTLLKAAELLRPKGMRVARLHCWEPLESTHGGESLARRFGFRDRPPVVMASRGTGAPQMLSATGLSAKELARKAWEAASGASGSRLSDRPRRSGEFENDAYRSDAAATSSRRPRDVVGRRPAAVTETTDYDEGSREPDCEAAACAADAAPDDEQVIDLDT